MTTIKKDVIKVEGENNESIYNPEDIQKFPDSIQELFSELPLDIQEKIFPKEEVESREMTETDVVELMSVLSPKEREGMLFEYLANLFAEGKYKQKFKEAFGKGIAGDETKRLLDVLWRNREKTDEEENEIFNKEYYQNLLKQRSDLQDALKAERERMEELDKRPKKSKSGKTQEEVNAQYRQILDAEEALKEFDAVNKNGIVEMNSFKDIAGRRAREWRWTTLISAVNKYFDSTEFATMVEEQFDRMFLFEKRLIARNRESDAERIDKVKKFMQEVGDVIQEWSEEHLNDKRVIDAEEFGNKIKRQQMLIKNLHSYMDDYKKGKKRGESDEQMIYTIRQMEIMLNLLKKTS